MSDAPPPPEGSKAVLTQRDNGISIHLPPLGVLNFNQIPGLILMFAALLLAGCPVLLALHFGFDFPADKSAAQRIASAVVSLLIGSGLLAWAVWLGTRRTTFGVVDQTLVRITASAFGQRQQAWSREQLAAIRIAQRRMGSGSGNRTTISELQLVLHDGSVLGMCAEREDAEMTWVAARLRQALDLPAETDAPAS